MTALIAIKDEDRVWIGGDGRVSEGSTTVSNSFIKWRRCGTVWWAAAGFARIYALAEKNINEMSGIRAPHGCFAVCEYLRSLADSDGWSKQSEEQGGPTRYKFDILVTDGHNIGQYAGDGSYISLSERGSMLALGSGCEYALGAAFAVLPTEGAEMAVQAALTSSARYEQTVGGDFFIKEILP